MKIKDALELKPKEVICLVGGGGKSTLLYALANELAGAGFHVITTTTTKMLAPTRDQSETLIVENDLDVLVQKVQEEFRLHRHITIAPEKYPSGKLESMTPETVVTLAEVMQVDYIIIEADGAAHHSLKAPRETEPVIPANTTLVIAVAGIDSLGGKLADVVFRPEIAAKLLCVPLETIITPELIAKLITLPRGIAKGTPVTARIVPFINKVDIAGGLANGMLVAIKILAAKNPQIDRVLLGQARRPKPVLEVIFNSNS